MCQSLVHKVAQSKQLLAVADLGVLELFESWLEELEDEVLGYMTKFPEAGDIAMATELGLSKSGAEFLLTKLRREARL